MSFYKFGVLKQWNSGTLEKKVDLGDFRFEDYRKELEN